MPKRFDHRPSRAALIAAIDAERDRRLAAGFSYDFADEGLHWLATTPADLAGWAAVTAVAQAMMLAGSTDRIVIRTETGTAHVTAAEWNAAMLHYRQTIEQPVLLAALALKAMNPIPQDAANPAYWPD